MRLKPSTDVTLKPLVRNLERVFFDCIVNTCTIERKVYNNDDITIFSVY